MSFDPGSFLASLVVSSVGFVLLTYGRKMSRVPHGLAGIVLLVFPYFVSAAWLVFVIAAAILALLWGSVKLGW
jgi:hypothetical protein